MIGGRLFGVTDPGRYLSTDAIDNPVMLLEYVKRNQNWSDNGGVPLIRTGAVHGSFDDSGLDELKALSISRQIDTEDQQWTDSLSKSICETFYLASRQDSQGYECVHYLMQSNVPTTTVEIGTTVPGSIGMVEEPRAENVYVEPYINYAYDYATEKFTKSLRIEGVRDNSVWSSDLTPGFSGTDGESIWNTCRTNYLKYGRVEKMPAALYEQWWIPDYTTAVWKINKMIEWQSKKRFPFSVFYTMGRSWFCGKQIYVKFPNETNDFSIRSIITKMARNKNANKIDIGVTFLDALPPSFYYIMYQVTNGASTEWQPTDGATTEYQEV